MAYDPVRNFCRVNVSQGYNSTATTIQLALGEGSKLPDPSTEGQYNLVWWNATDYSDPTDDPYKEIVRVTAKSGDQITILRGQEGTTAQNHNLSGKSYKMMLTLTKKTYEDLQTIEVYKDGTLAGQRARLNFQNFTDISDDTTNQRINLNLGIFMQYNFGDGSDGDLIISTGTTTINLGGNKVFIRKYRNFKITGNANLTFTNPHDDGTLIVFLIAGDCELTSNASNTIDLRNLGGLGGSGESHGRGFFDIMKGRVYNNFIRNIPLNQGTGGASSVNEPPNSEIAFSVHSTFDANMNIYGASGGRGGGGLLILVGRNLITSSSFTINASGSDGNTNSGNTTSGGYGGTGYAFRFTPRPVYKAFSNFVPKEFLPLPGAGGGGAFMWQGSGTIRGGGGSGGSVLIAYRGTKTGSDVTFNVSGGTGGNSMNGADGIGLIVPITAIIGL
jgi:hypothetical protein